MIGIFSPGILKIPHLATFLAAPVTFSVWGKFRRPIQAIAGWGLRPTALSARRYAERHAIPYLALEDGFLRSVGLGNQDPPWSLLVDDLGIYYDASRPSRLESLIPRPLSPAESARAADLITAWRAGRVSKYNHLREFSGELPDAYVLVVDQTFGDTSIRHGMAGPDSFQRMLQAALAENPGCTVLLKIHPDVFAGRKRGHFDPAELAGLARVTVLAEDVHPVRLIENARAVYAVTSQMGFEGLLWGKPVRTFGMPFYAGWGLTQDELPSPQRRRELPAGAVGLAQLVHATLIDYPRYVDPETGRRCAVETLLAHLALQRRMRARFPAVVYALRFSLYKKPIIRVFFQGSRVCFIRRPRQAPAGGVIAVWGSRDVLCPPESVNEHGPLFPHPPRLIRLEDGFLRSVGLGADLTRPLSWVMDGRGIYYDARFPSDLEHLLATADFPPGLLERARRLRERVVNEGLTKYNVGGDVWQRPARAGYVILVPGQVESDASIRYGGAHIRTNLALLQAVRAANPDAYVLYKPHPDVQTGLRAQGSGEQSAEQYCDELVLDVPMQELLEQVDAVHVLTSLTGFEALLRGKPVTTYGQPFYAGWGLTHDAGLTQTVAQRRKRCLELDALVAGVLIEYPAYVSRTSGRFTTPERALDELLAWRQAEMAEMPAWKRCWRWALRGGLRLWARLRRHP
ncbi:MAG: capsular polysaccharide biosynthesis protein [Methylococcaceae bacterium]|nr:MAG: capsular polysaccharide biosynthesis protein [Methylococcaceae bacterium]